MHDRLDLPLDQQQQGGQLLDAQSGGDPLLGVGVDDREAERPVLRVDGAAQRGKELLALGHTGTVDQQQSGDLLGVGDQLLEALLGDGDLVRGRGAGADWGTRGRTAGGLLQGGQIDDSVRIGHR